MSTVNCNRTFYNVRYVERIETTLTEEKKATRPNCKLFRKQYDCKYFFFFKGCSLLGLREIYTTSLCSQMSVPLVPMLSMSGGIPLLPHMPLSHT